MVSAENPRLLSAAPALATTYEGDDIALLERMVPLVDLIEISPDAIARIDSKQARLRPEVLDEYACVSSEVRFIAHGIGLSIGSFDHWDEGYLVLLDELFARVPLEWHSEHLAISTVAGESVGTMFPVPRTTEALDLVCERVRLIQERYRVPFLLEHVIHLLPDAPAEFTPAGFLNAITARTGCGLILDAYNLQCDVVNQGLNIRDFLDELDLNAVREMHLDIHSRLTDQSTLDLASAVVPRAPNLRAVTFELLKEAVPMLGYAAITGELSRIRKAIS
jgi:uncharacterized protein (UPF0276 family)